MEFHQNHSANSPSSSTSSTATTPNPNTITTTTTSDDPMHSWWESISKARSRIHSLSSILPPSISSSLSSLADSDRPALSLLSSIEAYTTISSSLSSHVSGSGSDPLCQWFYETFLSSDPHLRLVVLSFVPLLSGIYLSRIHSLASDSPSLPSLAGFEAVILAVYASETKARGGKPVLVNVPDLSQPSLYHTPRNKPNSPSASQLGSSVGVLSPALEPQIAIKSTKRACIVGVVLDCYYKQISQMPSCSKLDFCRIVATWAGQDCNCQHQFDDEVEEITGSPEIRCLEDGEANSFDVVVEKMNHLAIENGGSVVENFEFKGSRIPLPWELLQPTLRILGHCLLGPLFSEDVRKAAGVAVRRLYARAFHDLVPQAILATRSLINLDKRARVAAKAAASAATNSSSNANTPSKAKKPEILLVSK